MKKLTVDLLFGDTPITGTIIIEDLDNIVIDSENTAKEFSEIVILDSSDHSQKEDYISRFDSAWFKQVVTRYL